MVSNQEKNRLLSRLNQLIPQQLVLKDIRRIKVRGLPGVKKNLINCSK
jgi:hypothetical protein